MEGLDAAGSVTQALSNGGKTIQIFSAALTGAEALVGAALFCALAVLLVKQLTGSGDEVRDTSYALRRACGMLAIVFVVVLLAKGAAMIADDFTSTMPENDVTGTEVKVTHHGTASGGWSDGETRDFSDLGGE